MPRFLGVGVAPQDSSQGVYLPMTLGYGIPVASVILFLL